MTKTPLPRTDTSAKSFLIDNFPAPVLWIDADGQILSANPAAERFFSGGMADRSVARLLLAIKESETSAGTSDVPLQVELEVGDHTFLFTIVRNDTSDSFYVYGSDITEHKRGEHLQRLMQVSIDHGVDAAFWMGPDARFIYVNQAACLSLGYTSEELLQMTVADIGPNFSIKTFPELWKKLRQNVSMTFETKHRTKDGRIFPVEITTNFVNFEGKEYNCAVARDISERKKAEKNLSGEQAFSQAVIDSLPGVFYVIHESGTYRQWNKNLEKITGYTSEEIPGLHPLDLFEGETKQLVADRIGEVFTKGSATVEADLITKTGEVIPYHFTGVHAVIEDANYMVGVGIDITDRRRAQRIQTALYEISEATNLSHNLKELLKTIQNILGTLIDTTNFYVALYDENTQLYNFPYCDDEFDVIGFQTEDLRKSLTDYVRRTGKAVLVDEAKHQQLKETSEVDLVGEPSKIWLGAPLKTPAASIGVVAVQSYTDPNKYSETDLEILVFVSGYIAMAIERKRHEAQKQHLQEELESAQRMESMGILAGGVAHQLNNMLGPLVGYPELILRQLPTDSPFKDKVTRMGKAATDCAEVIQDLLCLARRGRYEKHPVDLNSIVENYLDSPSFGKLATMHPGVKVDFKQDESIAKIDGSPAHLSKVVMNLILNAMDGMPDGGRLSIETSQQYVERLPGGYENIVNDNYVLLRVRDTGHGIAPEDIDSIFEPYFSRKSFGNTGLGLAVVYGILKEHKGYYDINSQVGEGTDFVAYLPIATEKHKTDIERQPINGGTESILVVDDIRQQRELAVEMLTSLGYLVHTATDGHKALEFLATRSVDLVVQDMILEENFDGLDTYREIIKLHPGQKIVIISGFATSERIDDLQQLGAGPYVRKPFTLEAIGQAIRNELDGTTSIETCSVRDKQS